MNLIDYQDLALRTEAPLPGALARLNHAGLGFFSEGGEIATPVKRIAIYGKTLDSVDKDGSTLRAHIAEELGDLMWYVAIASSALGLNVFADMPAVTSAPLGRTTVWLASKVGEFLSYLAMCEGQTEMDDESADADNFADMLREMLVPIVNIADAIGIPLEVIAADNIAKLTLRYPDKFSTEAAEARADKGGADARNS